MSLTRSDSRGASSPLPRGRRRRSNPHRDDAIAGRRNENRAVLAHPSHRRAIGSDVLRIPAGRKVPAVGEIDLEFVSSRPRIRKTGGGADACLHGRGVAIEARQDARRPAAKRERDCLRAIGTRRQRDAHQLAGQIPGRAPFEPEIRRHADARAAGHPLAPDREHPRRRSGLEVERDRIAEDDGHRRVRACRQIDEQRAGVLHSWQRAPRVAADTRTTECPQRQRRWIRQRGIVREAKEGYRSRQADQAPQADGVRRSRSKPPGHRRVFYCAGFTTGSPNTSALKRQMVAPRCHASLCSPALTHVWARNVSRSQP